ncbi:McrC family protein [Helicobacter sp. Faydin-H64]|uniref:McrC family protein n=2 Tax=Helicobacter turcicus TaxID=2867412 RepID=A0ABS7JP37_9HELI|nr:McrC family protein [Helicobacter turcicus]MBX7546033.1 McrC family protein [Helicobacter turcicus]
MKHKNLCIAEWQCFNVEDIKQVLGQNNAKIQAEKIFDELREFAQGEGNHIFLKFAGKKLKAQNYVGLIQTKSGFCVEILPKIFAKESEGYSQNCTCKEAKESQNAKCEVCAAKTLLLSMLKTLKNSPFKQSHLSSLKTQNLPLLEVFVLMFLEQCEGLIKRGIVSHYVLSEENRKFLKGKLLFNQNLKTNLVHKERFFTSSDEFSLNIAPNRLIKTTLEFLDKQNLSSQNQSKLTQIRFIFADIPQSQNIHKDFTQCHTAKQFKSYELLLLWCKIFLKKQSFTPYYRDSKAFALLFDMNVLFESFVANTMKKWLHNKEFREREGRQYEDFMKEFLENTDCIKTQECKKYLAQEKENGRKFLLKPDIVGYQREQEQLVFIADTKWKILNQDLKNISIPDVYQIWAYLSKYKCKKGFLIYPLLRDCESKRLTLEFKPEIPCFENKKASFSCVFFPLECK